MTETAKKAASSSAAPDEKKGPVADLVEKYATLEAECAEHKNLYLRSLADFDNYRRRVQRDFDEVRRAAVESLMSELVPVLDNFERALAAMGTRAQVQAQAEGPEDGTENLNHSDTEGEKPGVGRSDEGQEVRRLREGVVLIRRQLAEALAQHGLCEFSCLGEEFDPRRAEAVSFVECDERRPGLVVEEHCRGYSCDGRVIRPAKVVVVKEKTSSSGEMASSQED